MKKTSSFQNSLIWFGAAVSIAEILTGTYFAPLGFTKGLLAILTFSDDVSDMFLPLWSAPERKPSSRETTTASAHGA